MIVTVIALAALAVVAGIVLYRYLHVSRANKALERAKQAGVCIDEDGMVDAEASFAGMMMSEEANGQKFAGKQARFMELMRIVAEGPRNVDEIRFLFEEDISAVVRPDGIVYVPCIENEHLYMEGEIELREEDLEVYSRKEEFLARVAKSPVN